MKNTDDEKLDDKSKKRNILKSHAKKLTSTGKDAVKKGLDKGKIGIEEKTLPIVDFRNITKSLPDADFIVFSLRCQRVYDSKDYMLGLTFYIRCHGDGRI